ncbi:hypothetical protein TWF481_001600 [Arthrobotrys musiformis]|uniref:Uncharacterized protein n=1 Tax=Arthrobotrys musiformis TaxID=47236 RepID=A0AAV9VTQ3_9PEZI
MHIVKNTPILLSLFQAVLTLPGATASAGACNVGSASSGVLKGSEGGSLTIEARSRNSAYKCSLDETGSGTSWTKELATASINGALTISLPQGLDCEGKFKDFENLCVVRCQDSRNPRGNICTVFEQIDLNSERKRLAKRSNQDSKDPQDLDKRSLGIEPRDPVIVVTRKKIVTRRKTRTRTRTGIRIVTRTGTGAKPSGASAAKAASQPAGFKIPPVPVAAAASPARAVAKGATATASASSKPPTSSVKSEAGDEEDEDDGEEEEEEDD